jgi:hypothetical protein
VGKLDLEKWTTVFRIRLNLAGERAQLSISWMRSADLNSFSTSDGIRALEGSPGSFQAGMRQRDVPRWGINCEEVIEKLKGIERGQVEVKQQNIVSPSDGVLLGNVSRADLFNRQGLDVVARQVRILVTTSRTIGSPRESRGQIGTRQCDRTRVWER